MVFNNRALKYSSNRLFISEVSLHLQAQRHGGKQKRLAGRILLGSLITIKY